MLLGEKLLQEKLINQAQLDEALGIQKTEPSRKIGEILVSLGYLDPMKFAEILARDLGEKK